MFCICDLWNKNPTKRKLWKQGYEKVSARSHGVVSISIIQAFSTFGFKHIGGIRTERFHGTDNMGMVQRLQNRNFILEFCDEGIIRDAAQMDRFHGVLYTRNTLGGR
jgi:hypothetical protein